MQFSQNLRSAKTSKGLVIKDLRQVQLFVLMPWRHKKFFPVVILCLFLQLSTYAQSAGADWSLFRGRPDLTGWYESELPSAPVLLWSLSTGVSTKSSPVVSDGTIFFGNDKGVLTAVTADGKIRWKYESGSSIDAAPMVFGNKVIIGSNDGILRALDKVTGKLIWSYTTDNQIAGSANVWVEGNRAGIVVGSYDYYLHCVDPKTGKQLWKVETENYVNGTPAIHNNRIVFGGCDGMIRVVDPLTGIQKDTIQIGVYIASSPALSGDMAYFGDYDGTKYCLNTRSKKMIWKISGGEESGSILSIPAVGNNLMVIGSEDRFMYCYNAATGKLIWKYRTNGRITGSAVITSTRVLFGGMDGNITILGLSDGKKIWNFNAGTPVSSSPAVVNGIFYILAGDGRLLAFANKKNQ